SVPTLDDAIWRVTEPGTAPPRQRLRAVRALADAGVRVEVALAPILPGLSDRPELLADAVRAARDAGAAKLWTTLLYLKPCTRDPSLRRLARGGPAEAERRAALYARAASPPREEAQHNAARVAGLAREHPRRAGAPAPIEPEPPRVALQLGFAFAEAVGENRA